MGVLTGRKIIDEYSEQKRYYETLFSYVPKNTVKSKQKVNRPTIKNTGENTYQKGNVNQLVSRNKLLPPIFMSAN